MGSPKLFMSPSKKISQQCTFRYIKKTQHAHNKNNSTKSDIRELRGLGEHALRELKNRQDIVIKPPDKGGKIVLWPTEQ